MWLKVSSECGIQIQRSPSCITCAYLYSCSVFSIRTFATYFPLVHTCNRSAFRHYIYCVRLYLIIDMSCEVYNDVSLLQLLFGAGMCAVSVASLCCPLASMYLHIREVCL